MRAAITRIVAATTVPIATTDHRIERASQKRGASGSEATASSEGAVPEARRRRRDIETRQRFTTARTAPARARLKHQDDHDHETAPPRCWITALAAPVARPMTPVTVRPPSP
jgi:hypothetical protein